MRCSRGARDSVRAPAPQPDGIPHFLTSASVAGSCLTVVLAPPPCALGAQTSRPHPRSTTSSPSALNIVARAAVRRPVFHHHRRPCIVPAAVMQRCRAERRMKAARERAQTRYRMRGRARRRARSRRCEGRQTRSSERPPFELPSATLAAHGPRRPTHASDERSGDDNPAVRRGEVAAGTGSTPRPVRAVGKRWFGSSEP